MIRAAIAGATGYTGAELVKLIAGHPEAELTAVTSRTYNNQYLADIFPAMGNLIDLKCEEMEPERLINRIDCIFLALPHKVSMKYAAFFVENNIKTIDLSADFRFKSVSKYEQTYQKHLCPHLLEKAVYGLSEIYRQDIKNAALVGNPGCYPTSLLLPLIPLLKEKIIKAEGIISDSKSGVSGAGRSLSLSSHFCEVNESFKPYKIGAHRHVPEMEEILSRHAEKEIRITFVPHLLPLSRGMLTTIYAEVENNTNYNDISDLFHRYYGKDAFIRILSKGKFPDTAHVRGTNFCDIGFWLDDASNRLVIVSAIDNILKGAAGQAVQNMNLMFGLDEKTGLTIFPSGV